MIPPSIELWSMPSTYLHLSIYIKTIELLRRYYWHGTNNISVRINLDIICMSTYVEV
jgi:hypothetical protein